jgi:molybdate transport system permease protein
MTDSLAEAPYQPGSDKPFYAGLLILSGVYLFLIVAMLLANMLYIGGAVGISDSDTSQGWMSVLRDNPFVEALARKEVRYAIKLSLISCTITTLLSLWVSVPLGYLLSRYTFRGKGLLDAILDIPIVLPPLVIGLSLLILFRTGPGFAVENFLYDTIGLRFTYAVPGVILAQFMVACAFAVRTMRATFDEIPPRREQVAMTLGCSRGEAFWRVTLPEARRGLLVAATLAWARALGEFGPILIFAGSTRMKTEVMPTTVFLHMQVGDLEGAVAVSMLMILAAMIVLMLVRLFGQERYVR